MKKFISLSLVFLLLLFGTVGCQKDDKEDTPIKTTTEKSEKASTREETEAPTTTEATEETQNMSISLSDTDIVVAGVELAEKDGTFYLRVYYDVTNTSGQIFSPFSGFHCDRLAFQNDTQLTQNHSDIDKIAEYANYGRYIYHGVTIRVCENFELLDTDNTVQLFVSERNKDTGLLIDLDIDNLPELTSAPEIVPIPKVDVPTTWLGYLGVEGDIESTSFSTKIHLKIVDHSIFEVKGQNYVRVFFEYTPMEIKDDKDSSAFMTTRYWFYQDGILLGTTTSLDMYGLPKAEGVGGHSDDIPLGETGSYTVTRALNSDSDILVLASYFANDPVDGESFIGTVISVK